MVLPVIGELRLAVRFQMVQRIRERHIPVNLMVSVCLTVCGDMNQLWPVPRIGEAGQQSLCKTLASFQQTLECNRLRYWSVIEKECYAPAGR